MPEFFIDGRPLQAEDGQTVMQAARAAGIDIPALCWHSALSAPGNCRVCAVEVVPDAGSAGGGWIDIACNMPVTAGLRVLTDSERVRQRRRDTLQFLTLNHPVDCGICDKAGECLLQDYHYAHQGGASVSRELKLHASKHVALSPRIVLDNERCILCTRCVRFTREVSKSRSLAVIARGDQSLIRPTEDGAFAHDAYSDNVVDLCPVGALLSRRTLHGARVWMLQATPSVCPGCARGCRIDVWHRRGDWAVQALDERLNRRVERVTPRENPQGPWICNKGRDLALAFGRPRALQPLLRGQVVDAALALARARALLAAARAPVALVSSSASNEALQAFAQAFTERPGRPLAAFVKTDADPAPGEVLQDEFLILADKTPNRSGALALFPPLPEPVEDAFPPGCDLVLVWGEGCRFSRLPRTAKTIVIDSWLAAELGQAEVFLPLATQLEQRGSFTNAAGDVNRFDACWPAPAGVFEPAALFATLATALQAEEATP